MRFERFIARRFSRDLSGGEEMSRPAIRIAIAGIALGLAVMIISVAVVIGFKREVTRQVTGFGSHIIISSFDGFGDLDETPIEPSDSILNCLRNVKNVREVQRVGRKPGVIQTENAFQGVILKGVDDTYCWDFFSDRLLQGEIDSLNEVSNWAIISQKMAEQMELGMGERFTVYFVGDKLRARRFTVKGIYQTTFSEYDKLYILTDISHIRQLNKWNGQECTSLELLVDDWLMLDQTQSDVFDALMNEGDAYSVETITGKVPQIFEWLDMLDMNAVIILTLMMLVSGFCIIAGLLILVLERTQTIGLLKAMGATNRCIRHIFMIQSLFLIGWGLLWGNILGLSLIGIQYFTGVMPLDASAYYVDHVPVWLPWQWWIILNVGMVVIGMLMLIGPSHIVSKIKAKELIINE